MNFELILKCAGLLSGFKIKLTAVDSGSFKYSDYDLSFEHLIIKISNYIHSNKLDNWILTLEVEGPNLNLEFSELGSEMRMKLYRILIAWEKPIEAKIMVPLHMPGRSDMVDIKDAKIFPTLEEALVWADQQQAHKLPENKPWKIEIVSRHIQPNGHIELKVTDIDNPRMEFK